MRGKAPSVGSWEYRQGRARVGHLCSRHLARSYRVIMTEWVKMKDSSGHIAPGGTDKSNGGDYENRLRYVKFGGLAILKP